MGVKKRNKNTGESWLLEIWMWFVLWEMSEILIVWLAIRLLRGRGVRAGWRVAMTPPGRGWCRIGNFCALEVGDYHKVTV